MPEHTYTKKYIKKDGSFVIYNYNKDASKYSKNYYEKQISQPKVECQFCHCMVYPHYLNKHQKTSKCKKSVLLSDDSENSVDMTPEQLREIFLSE
jgi:hypothetical protein